MATWLPKPVSTALIAATLTACSQGGPPPGDTATPSTSERAAASGTPLETAPAAARVDLVEPVFSDPTNITNPLFPITTVTQAVQLGMEGDVHLRHEITLLPETRHIEWNGQQVETIVSQFVAYGDGRLLETAHDFFAQADDGSVWYFGEDVFNYQDGVVANQDGTWLAGRDGPPGMIMPANPQVGDVYRPENIPGLVFEEVTVRAIDETVDGPIGQIQDAVSVREVLMDGVIEDKVFAKGYGEFIAHVASEDEFVTIAVAIPPDLRPTPPPAELDVLVSGARQIFADAPTAPGAAMGPTFDEMTGAWDAYRSSGPPELLGAAMDGALDELRLSISGGDPAATRHAAADALGAAADLSSQHQSATPADIGRLEQAARQAVVDAEAGDTPALMGGIAIARAIWERVGYTIDDTAAAGAFEAALHRLAESTETELTLAAADEMVTAVERIASSY